MVKHYDIPIPTGDVLTVAEAAEFLRCGKSFVHKATRAGKLPHRRLGNELRFLKGELLHWLDTQPGAVRIEDLEARALVERTAVRIEDLEVQALANRTTARHPDSE